MLFDRLTAYRQYYQIRKRLLQLVQEDPSRYSPEEKHKHALDGSIKIADVLLLKDLLTEYKPKSILEIGSFIGFSSRWILEVTHKWGAELTAVDPNIRHRIFNAPRDILEKLNSKYDPGRLEIVTAFFGKPGESVYYDYEHYEPIYDRARSEAIIDAIQILDDTWDRKFDFIFIDGEHSYDAVMADFKLAVGFLNPKGCIAFHDALSWPEVTRALESLKGQWQAKADVGIMAPLKNAPWDRIPGERKRQITMDGIGYFKLK